MSIARRPPKATFDICSAKMYCKTWPLYSDKHNKHMLTYKKELCEKKSVTNVCIFI